MANELEGFSGLTDAEKDAIWGAGVYSPTVWDEGELTKETTITYNGNPTVCVDDDPVGSNGAGYAYRDQIPVGDAAVFRMWIAVRTPAVAGTDTFRWGLLRYSAAGALVDAVYVESETENYEGAWSVIEGALAVGGNSFVRPFFSMFDGGAAYVGLMDVMPIPVSFSAYLDNDQSAATGDTVVFETEDYDYGGVYNTGTGHFTAPVAGLYSLSATLCLINVHAGNYVAAVFSINAGTSYIWGANVFAHADNDDPIVAITHPALLLAAGDTVEVLVSHDYGANRNVYGAGVGGKYTYFAGTKLN